MKLELKELAPYLPYGLKCSYACIMDVDNDYTQIMNVRNIQQIINGYGTFVIKPILRPLSDLKNEFTCPEGVVMPVGYFYSYADKVGKGHISEVMINLSALEYRYLLKYHFDVFGLIDKGLAIDINTL